MNPQDESTQESPLISKENSTGPVDTARITINALPILVTETGEKCIHHWIIESAEDGKVWLDAQCKKCFEERKYKSTMLTKYQPVVPVKVESLDVIIQDETKKADKEDEQEW